MIKIESLNLRYPLMGHFSHSLQSHLLNSVGGVLAGKTKELVSYVHALRDINLFVSDGSRVGIIGHNGAGKTTLLRVISGVYPPSSGEITTNGTVHALTDFTLGMDPNADGIKNIIFRLIFMGYKFADAKKAVDDIVDFSGLGEFINLPIRTYSTGMYLRLAFSISTHFAPDILVLDEVIGAGDESFRDKAQKRLDHLIDQSRIVVLSSHDIGAINKYCTRTIWMDKGSIMMDEDSKTVTDSYLSSISR